MASLEWEHVGHTYHHYKYRIISKERNTLNTTTNPHRVRKVTAVSCIQQTGSLPSQAVKTSLAKTTAFQIMDGTKCLMWNEKMARGLETRGWDRNNEHHLQQYKAAVAGFRKMPTIHQSDRTLKRTQRIGQWFTQTDTERDKERSRGEREKQCSGGVADETDM